MCWLISCCTHEMDSTPPATYTSPSLATTRCAASAMVCRPEEQNRFTVRPDTVTGQPARNAAWRAILEPVAPSGKAQPISTSSTSPASIPARVMAWEIAWPASVAPWVILKAPFQLLVSGVRAVETIRAAVMGNPQLKVWPAAARRANRGAGCQKPASACGLAAKRCMVCTTVNKPSSSAYSIGPPRKAGKP